MMSKEVCDIQNCNNETDTVVTLHTHDNYTEIAMCSYHYHDFKYGENPEVTLTMKDYVYARYKHN
jgi:hypothetical protein